MFQRLENLGYIEFLIKLLINFSRDNDRKEYNEYIDIILNQVKLIIKLNSGRCEQFVHLDGLNVINKLLYRNQYAPMICPILSELILSTKYVREELKKINAFEILIKLINKENFADIINNILFWLNDDKQYIEAYFSQDNSFIQIITQVSECFELNDYLSILLKFFEESEISQIKYFANNKLIYDIMDLILSSKTKENKEIYLIIKIIDFLDYLVTNRRNEIQFYKDIQLFVILDWTVKVSKENSLVILEEKIKNLNFKLNKI
jgi:hypothetical protein